MKTLVFTLLISLVISCSSNREQANEASTFESDEPTNYSDTTETTERPITYLVSGQAYTRKHCAAELTIDANAQDCGKKIPIRTTLIIKSADTTVTSVKTDDLGKFELQLVPGNYQVTTRSGPLMIDPTVSLVVANENIHHFLVELKKKHIPQ